MLESRQHAVTRAIQRMHAELNEPLTIDDLARTARYSRFHFTRVFEKTTGVSPGRFLAAIRIDEAKRLLRETPLTVTEISHRVGWSSVGSFSTRFSASVGVPPSVYRSGGSVAYRPMERRATGHHLGVSTSIQGRLRVSELDLPGYIFIGLFHERIPQGRPAACLLLHGPGDYTLSPAPVGRWHVLACGLPPDCETGDGLRPEVGDRLLVASSTSVSVRPDTTTINVDLDLHRVNLHDPPVLLSLGHLSQASMTTVSETVGTSRRIASQRRARPTRLPVAAPRRVAGTRDVSPGSTSWAPRR